MGTSPAHSAPWDLTSSGSGEGCSARFQGSCGSIGPKFSPPLGCLHLRLLQGHFNSMGRTNRFAPANCPVGPSATTMAVAGPFLRDYYNPYPVLPGRYNYFYRCLYLQVGHAYGEFPDLGNLVLYRPQVPHYLFGI